jgi:predicted nucleic-acid-binding protein
MRGLDTNVILRYLVTDDPQQSETVEAVFEDANARQERLFLSTVALCELVWTLRKQPYGIRRAGIVSALEKLLAAGLFEVQDRDLVNQALSQYWQGRADFPDYLLGCQGRRAGCEVTLTFDRRLRNTPGFSLLA